MLRSRQPTTAMSSVRSSAVAGTWYPGHPGRLAAAVDGFLAQVPELDLPCPRAVVAPHAGLRYSGLVAAYAYSQLARCRYSAAVLVGPSHFVSFRGVALWPRGNWETPLGAVPIAETLALALSAACAEVIERPDAHGREHSLEMQLPFVAHLLPGLPIVPLVMGHQERQIVSALGEALANVVGEWERSGRGRVLLVASTDLSHYHDAETAAQMDEVVADFVVALDSEGLMSALEREPRHACGGGPLASTVDAAVRLGARQARVLRYADSGDVSGDKSSVVGYLAAQVW